VPYNEFGLVLNNNKNSVQQWIIYTVTSPNTGHQERPLDAITSSFNENARQLTFVVPGGGSVLGSLRYTFSGVSFDQLNGMSAPVFWQWRLRGV
jgi:hypothetical protein